VTLHPASQQVSCLGQQAMGSRCSLQQLQGCSHSLRLLPGRDGQEAVLGVVVQCSA
jgi:hypothetical protein